MKKKLFKTFALIFIACIAATILFAMPACGDEAGTGGNITLIFTDDSGSAIAKIDLTTEAKVLADVMNEVQERCDLQTTSNEKVDIDFVTSGGAYGTTIESYIVNGTFYGNWNEGKYVMLYTSLEDAEYISVYDGSTLNIEGANYNACGLGADSMPIIAGATYLFTVVTF